MAAVIVILLVCIALVTGFLGTVLEALGAALCSALAALGRAIGLFFVSLFTALVSGLVRILGMLALPALVVFGILSVAWMIRRTFFSGR